MRCCELFYQTSFFKAAHGEKLIFYVLAKEWREVKLKKVAFDSSLPHFHLSAIHEDIGETRKKEMALKSLSYSFVDTQYEDNWRCIQTLEML